MTRYTTSGFLRTKLGDALSRRAVAPHIFETQKRRARICASLKEAPQLDKHEFAYGQTEKHSVDRPRNAKASRTKDPALRPRHLNPGTVAALMDIASRSGELFGLYAESQPGEFSGDRPQSVRHRQNDPASRNRSGADDQGAIATFGRSCAALAAFPTGPFPETPASPSSLRRSRTSDSGRSLERESGL